jgi:antitoxin ParD1/3/4
MTRQSISFTDPNTEWLHKKVVVEGEYRSNSDAANDAIRRMREAEAETNFIRAKLIAAEKSGFTDLTRGQILEKSKEELRENGEL